MAKKRIIIVGAGIAGSYAGIALARLGFDVVLCEQAAPEQRQQSEQGRTINFTLSERGRKCLEQLGLLGAAMSLSVPLFGRLISLPGLPFSFRLPYGRFERDLLHSISRRSLYGLLLHEYEKTPNAKILYQHKFESTNFADKTAEFVTPGGPKTLHYDLLIGADGVGSRVRSHLQSQQLIQTEIEQSSWVYTEETSLVRSAEHRNYLHVWPKWNSVVCGLPMPNGELILNRIFRADHADGHAHPIRRTSVDRWFHKNSVLLIGDSAHGMSPFLGQGMNLALEDAATLTQILSENKSLEDFQKIRKPICDNISAQSEDHFITLSRRLLNPIFIASNQIKIHRARPTKYHLLTQGDFSSPLM